MTPNELGVYIEKIIPYLKSIFPIRADYTIINKNTPTIKWRGSYNYNSNLISIYPYNIFNPKMSDDRNRIEAIKTILHEFGHYIIGVVKDPDSIDNDAKNVIEINCNLYMIRMLKQIPSADFKSVLNIDYYKSRRYIIEATFLNLGLLSSYRDTQSKYMFTFDREFLNLMDKIVDKTDILCDCLLSNTNIKFIGGNKK